MKAVLLLRAQHWDLTNAKLCCWFDCDRRFGIHLSVWRVMYTIICLLLRHVLRGATVLYMKRARAKP